MPLILRSVKGSNLTANEVDGNFTFLSSSIDNVVSGSVTVTSASYAGTASLAPNYLPLTGGTITGNIVVNGTGSFNYVVSNYESSSIIYSSGSTKFGDSQDDLHEFTGSVSISGSSLTLNNNAVVMSSQTSSMSVLNATSASYINGANVVGAVANAESASHALSALTSNVATSASYVSGTFVVASVINSATGGLFINSNGDGVNIGTGVSSSAVHIGKPSLPVDIVGIVTISGSLTSENVYLTGSLLGTSSYAINALTSSYTQNAETLDGLDSSVFVQTGSFNTFTSSYNTASSSISTRLTNEEATGSSLVAASSSFSLRTTELEAASGSFSTRATSLETASGSFSTRLTNEEATGSALVSASGSFSTRVTNTEATSSNLVPRTVNLEATASNLVSDSGSFSTRVSLNETTGSVLVSASGSFSTRTTSLEGRATNLEATASNLVSVSGSYSTRITDLETASGSFSTRATSLETASGSFSTRVTLTEATSSNLAPRTTNLEATASSLSSASGSFSTRVTTNETNISNLTSASGSFSTRTTSLETASGSFSTRVTDTEATSSNLTSASGSFSTRVTSIEGNYATTGSNTLVGTQYVSNTTNATGYTSTAALYTDGGLRVTKDAYFSSSMFIAGNITILGTQSIQYITSSQLEISDNIINVNTSSPGLRFGGIAVYDSGSTGLTGSFLWDSQNNKWIYSNPSGSNYDGGMAIFGPRNTSGLGSEQGTTNNALMKGQGGDHITSSNITDDGSKVSIPYGVDVTGSLTATTLVGSLNGSNLVDASVSNAKLANSAITIAGNSTSLGGSISAATILAGTNTFTSSAQVTGLTNANLSGTAGISNANLANSAITIAGSSTSLGGSISAATIGNAIGAFSGSSQVVLSSTTGYDANQHVDHTAVSISAGSGLSGGGTIASTRTLTLDTGSAHFLGGARGAISISDTTGPDGINLTYNSGTGVLSGTLQNSSITVSAGAGMSGGGGVTLGGSVTLTNAGVTSNVAGTGISVSGATGAVTITNTGVTSITAGSGISVNTSTGGVTVTNTITNNNQLTNGAGYITSAGTAANVTSISSATGGSYTWTNTNYFQSNLGSTLGSLSSPPLQAYCTGGNAAFMSFHRGGNYAVNMGLDSDNVMRIGGWSASANRWQLDMSGNMTVAGDVTAYSDERVKENIETVDNALDKVLALRGVYYNRIDSDDKRRKIGVIAQETLPIIPEVVNEDHDGMLNVAYGNLSGLFIEAFKQQQTLIHSQQSQIDELKELVNQLLNK